MSIGFALRANQKSKSQG